MLNNLLVWANSQINGQIKSTFESLDIQEEMTDVLSIYKIPAKYKEVQIIHNCIEQKPIVKMQVAQLHVILHNILTNALKHTHEKGRVIIDYDTSDKDKITLSILNEGEVMHQDLIATIQNINHLEPVNVKPSANSFGLGLKLVKKYVLENNGSLEIIPNSFTGTEIKINF
ncbi:HAMP domain-containing sensor histidine kinase [Mesonia sp. HuA40]|uniref:sensor histidine kinase n=1 Tax=Mesonia sp. HuA40 TaxID=2602761 RepID=UPI0016500699|nr:HAMP domain-containing sensor histidine kinase [Mesonia sp. HuA40]